MKTDLQARLQREKAHGRAIIAMKEKAGDRILRLGKSVGNADLIIYPVPCEKC